MEVKIMAMAMSPAVEKDEDTQQCISDCLFCHGVCLETAVDYCLKMGGRHADPDHIQVMLDCSEICQISADFMLRGSAFSTRICDICAEIENRCADSCDQFVNDERMKACADVCRRAAQSCRQVASKYII